MPLLCQDWSIADGIGGPSGRRGSEGHTSQSPDDNLDLRHRGWNDRRVFRDRIQAGGGLAAALPDLLEHLLPHVDLANLTWEPLHPRAARRAVKPLLALVVASSLALPAVPVFRSWPAVLVYLAMGTAAAVAITRRQVRCSGWVSDAHVVAVRRGWLWRSVTVAPVAKIQSVTSTESPFDRRAAMAAVGIDTAGGVLALPQMHIRYLARDTARDLAASLSAKAAQTTFRW